MTAFSLIVESKSNNSLSASLKLKPFKAFRQVLNTILCFLSSFSISFSACPLLVIVAL